MIWSWPISLCYYGIWPPITVSAEYRGLLIKYTDDTDTYLGNLLVPEHTDCQLNEEFGHIQNWALKNKRTINKAIIKELVFRRPHPTKFDLPDPLDGVAQERAAKLLGVIFSW